jgi:hypothetical protein
MENPEEVMKLYDTTKYDLINHLVEILKIVSINKSYLEGNCFYKHRTFELDLELFSKQINLFWCGTLAKQRICEIGFNAGHSTLLLLLSKTCKSLDYTIFDIGQHSYTKPCLEYIKSVFQDVNFEYIEGDSIEEMPKWIHKNPHLIDSYDIVHVDGGHSMECISNDMKNADKILKINGLMIIDDTNDFFINYCTNVYIETGNYEEVQIISTELYPHRIIKKLRN